MAGLPWDDWFYHLSARRDEINGLHTQAVNLQGQVQSNIIQLNADLRQVRQLVAGNQALLYMKAVTVLPDLKLKNFQTSIDALPPPPTGIIPLELGQLLSEALGGALVLKVLFNAGKSAVRGLFSAIKSVTGETATETLATSLSAPLIQTGATEGSMVVIEGAADGGGEAVAAASTASVEAIGEGAGEVAAETVLGSMTSASLAATGIGIFAAVGIDAVFGAIDGATERSQLDKQVTALQTCLSKVQTFDAAVTQKTTTTRTLAVDQQTTFESVIADLSSIKAPTFTYKLPKDFAHLSQFLAAQATAISEYGLLVQMRNTYAKAVKRRPGVTKDQIINNMLFTAPKGVTYAELSQYWDVLAHYSDAMKTAG